MNKYAEMAQAEEEAVEADEEDAAEAGELDPQPVEEPGEEEEPVVDEAALKRVNRALEDQKTRLAKILGDAAVAHDCILCGTLGYLPAVPAAGSVYEIVEAEGALTLAPYGPQNVGELKPAKDKEACPDCDATGEVLTGSKNPNAMVAACSKCNGNGWVIRSIDQTPQTIYVPPIPAQPNGIAQPPEVTWPDAWGRPPGHRDYNVPPASVNG